MAAKTPVAPGGVGAVDPQTGFGQQGLRVQRFYFPDLDDADTFVVGHSGVVRTSWEGDAAADTGVVLVTNQATGEITFKGAQDSSGFIVVHSRG